MDGQASLTNANAGAMGRRTSPSATKNKRRAERFIDSRSSNVE
jgi:hypothetical protein